MRPGAREFRKASLTVSMSTAVPEHMRERVREITHVFVPHAHRSQRMATALMNFVCQEADANKITLLLTAHRVEDAGGASVSGNDAAEPNTAQLIAWYEKFGFKTLQDTPTGTFMARQVHEKPRIKPVTLAVSRALH
jgi:GNAT superfamily N-acetyltransferase